MRPHILTPPLCRTICTDSTPLPADPDLDAKRRRFPPPRRRAHAVLFLVPGLFAKVRVVLRPAFSLSVAKPPDAAAERGRKVAERWRASRLGQRYRH